MGQYLALTGYRADGAECLALGLATHYLPSAALDEAKARIAADPAAVAAVLTELAVAPPAAKLLAHRETIDRLFAADQL
ncbi:enoyl-CoA hydratase/isomerase family protein, partial [Acinetobacter baumannii]